ncbi:hypothetical protein ON010_g16807 [Phytophthora cinnamomi]|nr:hypothetical protein ON010_g16807 [Phytophthora cinnamomi]
MKWPPFCLLDDHRRLRPRGSMNLIRIGALTSFGNSLWDQQAFYSSPSTMKSSSFKSTVSVTHISTATAILSIDDVNFLIDPAFGRHSDFEQRDGVVLTKTDDPALGLED